MTKNNVSRIFFSGFLAFIIIISLVYRKSSTYASKNPPIHIEKKKLEFLYRIIYYQILISEQMPKKQRNSIQEQIFQQINLLSKEYEEHIEVQIQNYIIHSHFSEKRERFPIDLKNIKNEKHKQIVDILHKIYIEQNKTINPNSELFYYPLGKIAFLDYLKYSDKEKHHYYYQQLLREIKPFEYGILFITFFTVISFFLGIYILSRFLSKIPQNFYGSFIRSLPISTIWLFVEASLIFLFLNIPVQLLIIKLISLKEQEILYFQIGYSLFIFAIVLLYLYNELGKEKLLQLFKFQVYLYKQENLLNHYIASEEKKEENFIKKIEFLIHEKNIKPLSLMKEIYYGWIGFIVIFPISLSILFFSMFVTGKDIQVEDAHPLSFLVPKYFLETFLLASILAPILEEFVFRNLIYGVLRYKLSVFSAGFLSGVIFASLHPQGVLAFPYLVFLGFSLAILREYRPSLLASIITHFCVNTLAIGMNYLMFKSF